MTHYLGKKTQKSKQVLVTAICVENLQRTPLLAIHLQTDLVGV